MKRPKPRAVSFAAVEGFRDSFNALVVEGSPEYDRFEIFLANKAKIPPEKLPGTMKDHALQGSLSAFRECHLSGDVLLIYTHENDVVTQFRVCRHADIKGKRGTKLAKELARRV